MKPQTVAFLAKESELLERAPLCPHRTSLTKPVVRLISRVFTRHRPLYSKRPASPKTHNGIQTEFARLTKDNPVIGREVRPFLSKTYNLKAIADYEAGPDSNITHQQAAEAIEAAKLFVSKATALIPPTRRIIPPQRVDLWPDQLPVPTRTSNIAIVRELVIVPLLIADADKLASRRCIDFFTLNFRARRLRLLNRACGPGALENAALLSQAMLITSQQIKPRKGCFCKTARTSFSVPGF